MRATIMGATVISLNLYGWYNKILPLFFNKLSAKNIFRRYDAMTTTILDQIIFAPYIAVSYLYWISMLEFQDIEKASSNVKVNLIEVLKMNYMFWPFVNYLNFRFIPFNFRIVVINLCAIAWNSYLAFRNQKFRNISYQPVKLIK